MREKYRQEVAAMGSRVAESICGNEEDGKSRREGF